MICKSWVGLSLIFLCAGLGWAAAEEKDKLADVKKASVEVLIDGRLNGSGWIATPDGSIITAAHVVWGKHQKIEVLNPGIGRLPAKIVATDPVHDLARLKIEKDSIDSDLPYIKLADRQPFEGSDVYLYGSALFRHWLTVKGGMARRETSYEFFQIINLYCEFSIIAAPSPHGTSGGCWVDSTGSVIGNQSGFINNNNSNTSSGLAIVAPLFAIRSILETEGDLKANSMGCGFEEVFSQSVGFLKRLPEGATGVLTLPIRENSPAKKAGLTTETLITHINGHPITYRKEFMSIFRKVKTGVPIKLRIITPDDHTPRDIELTPTVVQRVAEPKKTESGDSNFQKEDKI